MPKVISTDSPIATLACACVNDMKLLIDIGNTRTKWAIAGEKIVAHGDTSDGWASVHSYKESIQAVRVSCVGKTSVLSAMQQQIKDELSLPINVAKVTRRVNGLSNQYSDLVKLGVDRWVAAIGARANWPTGSLIVIDAGTAVTIDYVSAANEYHGGVILPGFQMMHDSLTGNTAGIASKRDKVVGIIGKTTQECVNSGVYFGLVGAVDRIVNEMRKQIDDEVQVIITGGDAGAIISMSALSLQECPNLLFDGLLNLSSESFT